VVKLLHNLHLSLDTLFSVWLDEFDFLVYFDSDLLIQNLVKPKPYDCVSALANTLADYVVFQIFERRVRGAELYLLRVLLARAFQDLVFVQISIIGLCRSLIIIGGKSFQLCFGIIPCLLLLI
jgi:hypothetical protein